jgi:hypothetical protein
MATNNMGGAAARSAQPAKGLLSGLVLGAEHMMLLGCGGLLVALVACGVITWWTISTWTAPADPTQQTVIVRRGEVEHSALDRCPAGMTARYTARGMVCR